jgi:hypothetical protein
MAPIKLRCSRCKVAFIAGDKLVQVSRVVVMPDESLKPVAQRGEYVHVDCPEVKPLPGGGRMVMRRSTRPRVEDMDQAEQARYQALLNTGMPRAVAEREIHTARQLAEVAELKKQPAVTHLTQTQSERIDAILEHWDDCENYTEGSCRSLNTGRVPISTEGTYNEYCAPCQLAWALDGEAER